jgi:hypothetical protein
MKKLRLLAFILLTIPFQMAKGQGSLEFRFTPNISAKPEIVNPSSAGISSPAKVAFDMGITYTRMLNRKWGIGAGVTLGSVVYGMDFFAPSTAFGTKQDKGIIGQGFYFDPYLYHGVSARAVHHVILNERTFVSILAEPSLRYYTYGADNYDGFQIGFNRAVQFNPDVPSTLPADLLIDIPATGQRFDLNIAASLGIERRLTTGSSLVFGLRKNFGLKPVGAGSLQVQMNDKIYTGTFNTRSGFIGLDLAYKYNFSKSSELIKKSQQSLSTGRNRKVIFGELAGNGIALSANFDMRLKPDRNDGFGISGGVGIIPDQYFDKYITLPLAINYIVGKRKNGFESGIGITAFYNLSGNENFFIDLDADEPHPKLTTAEIFYIGYRFQATKGFMFRVSNSFMYIGKGYFYPPLWPGLSIGYSLNKQFIQLAPKEKKEKEFAAMTLNGKYRKAIFVEGGGNGVGLSGNFDIRFKPGRNDGPGLRAGVGYAGVSYVDNEGSATHISVPLAYNYIFRNERSGIETGLGFTPTFVTNKTSQGRDLTLDLFYNLGYRLQPLKEGLVLRAMWTPTYTVGRLRTRAGLSLGYSFR